MVVGRRTQGRADQIHGHDQCEGVDGVLGCVAQYAHHDHFVVGADEGIGDAPVPDPAAADRHAAAATDPGAPDAPAESEVEAARERVYEEGRAALDEMRRSGGL